MKKNLFFAIVLFFASVQLTVASTKNKTPFIKTQKDSTRITELNHFWAELSRTVREGDFEGYKNTYHKDAVIVFASGKNKTSVSLNSALQGWKKFFTDTKSGKTKNSAEFRFSQRIGNKTTAHETGIFIFTSINKDNNSISKDIIHFEMLLVKRNNKWYGVMEYQKSNATQKEWDALK